MQDQNARSGRVVQAGPRDLDLLQLAQAVLAEIIDCNPVVRLGRMHSELAVQLPPSEPLWRAKVR